jgi:hypothetical protein
VALAAEGTAGTETEATEGTETEATEGTETRSTRRRGGTELPLFLRSSGSGLGQKRTRPFQSIFMASCGNEIAGGAMPPTLAPFRSRGTA